MKDWEDYRAARGEHDCAIKEINNWFGNQKCQYSWECKGARTCTRGSHGEPNGMCQGDDFCP